MRRLNAIIFFDGLSNVIYDIGYVKWALCLIFHYRIGRWCSVVQQNPLQAFITHRCCLIIKEALEFDFH